MRQLPARQKLVSLSPEEDGGLHALRFHRDAREPIARAGPWKFCVWHPRMAMHADFRARSFMSCILVVSLPPDGAASACV